MKKRIFQVKVVSKGGRTSIRLMGRSARGSSTLLDHTEVASGLEEKSAIVKAAGGLVDNHRGIGS